MLDKDQGNKVSVIILEPGEKENSHFIIVHFLVAWG